MFQPFRDFISKATASKVKCEESNQSLGSVLNLPKDMFSPCLQYDNFSKEWQNLSQQDTFDGFRLEAGKPISKWLQMSHTLLLGTQMRSQPYQYQFGPIFQSEDGRTFMMGKYNLDGLLNCRVVKKVAGPYVDLRANIGSCLLEPHKNIVELSKDLNFEQFSSSMKLVYQGVWIGNLGFSRQISNSLHLGAELTYLNLHVAASMGTLSGRWVSNGGEGPHIVSATLGRTPDFKNQDATPLHGIRLQYVNKVSERVSLGAELDYTFPDHESAMKVGYEYTFRTSRVQGLLDTGGSVRVFVNDFKGYALSGLIDYFNNEYKFGMLMHYYPVSEEEGGGEPMMM